MLDAVDVSGYCGICLIELLMVNSDVLCSADLPSRH